ncbi:MAG: hypothetical protein KGZ83_07850 [Sulfuricella sp.]|nr:hypothetical protein [Sulfuricella sp.]
MTQESILPKLGNPIMSGKKDIREKLPIPVVLILIASILLAIFFFLIIHYKFGWGKQGSFFDIIGKAAKELDISIFDTNFVVTGNAGGNGRQELHSLIYETMCIIQVSASILTAGIAISGPLYLTTWQQLSDSLFQALKDASEVARRGNLSEEELSQLRIVCKGGVEKMADLSSHVMRGRTAFRFALKSSATLLGCTMIVAFIPIHGFLHVGLAAITLFSLGLGLLFLFMIFEITNMSPIPAKLAIHEILAKIINNKI